MLEEDSEEDLQHKSLIAKKFHEKRAGESFVSKLPLFGGAMQPWISLVYPGTRLGSVVA